MTEESAPVRSRAAEPVFEPEFVALLTDLFDERIVFNRTLGVRLEAIDTRRARCTLAMRPELVGHFAYGRLHGGVISAALDAVAGVAVMAALGARHMDESPMQRMLRFLKLGTIDLRVDYVRPGIDERFVAEAEVLRLGSRVAATRMEFKGGDGTLMALGTGAYMVS